MPKITIERETLKRAAQALAYCYSAIENMSDDEDDMISRSNAALRAALAAQPAEPNMRHPKIQALIGGKARAEIELGLVEQLLEDPNFETTPMDMEHWGPLHDKLKAALTAQPAEPVARVNADGFIVETGLLITPGTLLYAVPPAPAAVPPEGMDAVAIKYAHKMALDLEFILAEYGGSWYNTAMQTLGEYRSEMNAIHECESPTFMGEPVLAAAGDKP